MAKVKKPPEEMSRDKRFRILQSEWCKQIARDPTLSANAVSVGIIIALEYLNSESWVAFPSYATLANEIGSKEDTAIAAVKALIGAGHLAIVVPGQKGRGKPNHYALVPKPKKTPKPAGVFQPENPQASGGFPNPENPQTRPHKTPAGGGMNHIITTLPNPPPGGCGGKADTAPPPAQPTDAEIDALAVELLAALPPRPDTTGKPSPKLRARVAAALTNGATRAKILAGAQRYRRYVQITCKTTGPTRYARKPELWMEEGQWEAGWEITTRNGAPDDEREALLREIQGWPQ
jgi:hypothetical protein